MNKAVVEQFT